MSCGPIRSAPARERAGGPRAVTRRDPHGARPPQFSESPPLPAGLSADAAEVVRRCLDVDPAARPTVHRLAALPFLAPPASPLPQHAATQAHPQPPPAADPTPPTAITGGGSGGPRPSTGFDPAGARSDPAAVDVPAPSEARGWLAAGVRAVAAWEGVPADAAAEAAFRAEYARVIASRIRTASLVFLPVREPMFSPSCLLPRASFGDRGSGRHWQGLTRSSGSVTDSGLWVCDIRLAG